MKKVILLTIFTSPLFCAAQTPINSNVIPKTFDQIIYQSATPLSSLMDSGANAYWDFSGFPKIAGDTSICEYINVPSTYKAKYPNATFSVKVIEFGQTYYEMYDKGNNNIHYWGFTYSTQSVYSVYSLASLKLKFPFSYGLSVTNNYISKSYNPVDSTTVQGIVELKGLGYGRLKLPDNTIYDSVQLAYILYTGTDNKGGKFKFETYEWYRPNYLDAIAVMNINYQWSGTQWNMMTPKFKYQKQPQLAPAFVGVNEFQRPKLELFPNPCKSRLSITSDGVMDRILITNIHGKVVYEMSGINESRVELDLSELNNQLYVVTVLSKEVISSSRLFVKSAD